MAPNALPITATAALVGYAALLGVLGSGPALAQDEHADLKIEFVDLPIANSQRDVQVRITNVST
jgi:hypothetical protein